MIQKYSFENCKSFSEPQKFNFFIEISIKEGDTPYIMFRKAAEILYNDSKKKKAKKIKSYINDAESFTFGEHKEIKQNNFYSYENCL